MHTAYTPGVNFLDNFGRFDIGWDIRHPHRTILCVAIAGLGEADTATVGVCKEVIAKFLGVRVGAEGRGGGERGW